VAAGKGRVPVLGLGIVPGDLEEPLQLAQDGALDLGVHVVPSPAAPGHRRVVVAEIHAAGEGDAPVHDQELAVIAHLPAQRPPPGTHRMEDGEQDARRLHPRHVVPEKPKEPAPSMMQRTRTPSCALMQTASTNRRPFGSLDQMYVSSRISVARQGERVEHRRVCLRSSEQPMHAVAGQHPLGRQRIALRLRRGRRKKSGAQAGRFYPDDRP